MQTRWHKHSHVWASCDRRSPPPRLLLSTRPHAGSTTSSEGVVGIELLRTFIRINAARTGASSERTVLKRLATSDQDGDDERRSRRAQPGGDHAGPAAHPNAVLWAVPVSSAARNTPCGVARCERASHRRTVLRPSLCLKTVGNGRCRNHALCSTDVVEMRKAAALSSVWLGVVVVRLTIHDPLQSRTNADRNTCKRDTHRWKLWRTRTYVDLQNLRDVLRRQCFVCGAIRFPCKH